MIIINKRPAHIEITSRQNLKNGEINKRTRESYQRIQSMYATARYFYELRNQPEDIRMPVEKTYKKIS